MTTMPSTARVAPSSDRLYRLLAGLFFLVLVLVYYLPSLGWLPRGIHEWAQADRLALAICFYDNGMHFFRPQTLNMSPIDGVVGVEFPVLPYLAALGAKLVGRAALAPLYRLLSIGTVWLACYHLFLLVFGRTRQVIAALVPGIFLLASPVFAYYAGNFVPDPVSASLVLVAAYYLLTYPASQRFGYLVGAIGLLTLATLIKLTSGIYLLAALGTLLLWGYLQPVVFSLGQRWLLLLLSGLSLGVIGIYTIYNQYLNETYQSGIFLASTRPLTSWAQFDQMRERVQRDWKSEYFVSFQYAMLKASALIVLLSLPRLLRTDWLWVAQIGIAAVGAALFVRVMGAQFIDHDYYVIASFWPLLLLLVTLATTQLAQRLAGAPRWLAPLLFGVVGVALLGQGLRHYRARMSDPYRHFSQYYSYRWMQGGAAELALAHVPTTATLLVLGEQAPNLSLVYFDRRGITWAPDLAHLPPSREVLQKMTESKLDYLVMRQEVFRALSSQHPDLPTAFQSVVSTSQYVVLKYPSAVRL
jgi:4-amino-4-deoxy-L-arabinose transferase-like glycosyltransferase